MDFWAHQEDARRRTTRLIILYAVLLLLLALCAGYVFNLIWMAAVDDYGYSRHAGGFSPFLQPELYVGAASLLGIVGILCLFSPASLSAGGKSVAETLNGTLITPQTRDQGERRLLNVVEEMALASGMPVPPVYILEDEPGINAFAAGCTINDAVVGVTRGTIDLLTRDELQAVVAHEFSHILNGDMKLDLRFVQLLFGLMCLSDFCGAVMRGLARGSSRRSGNKDSGKGIAVLMLLVLVVFITGAVMSFVGNIIQAAVNRQREFLADASSVQFTRSQALASALKKIGGLAAGSKLNNTPMTGSYRHLFFCSIHAGLLDTHPPLETRIRRLDPQWDGRFISVDGFSPDYTETPAEKKAKSDWQQLRGRQAASSAAWLGQVRGLGAFGQDAAPPPPLTAPEAVAILQAASREPLEASRMMLGLLLSDTPDIRDKQLAFIKDQAAKKDIRTCREAFTVLGEDNWLPLIELAIPALKNLSRRQFDPFRELLLKFISADGVFSFKEWVLYQLITSQAGAQFAPKPASPLPGSSKIPEAAAMVLSALARLMPEADAARCAFDAGKQSLDMSGAFVEAKMKPEKLSESVAVLAGSSLKIKERFMNAASCVVMHDGKVEPEEAMLLRVLSLCLGVPVPPEVITV